MVLRDLYRKQFANIADVKVHDIYGVSWDKGELPDLTRTDDAVGFTAQVGIDTAVVTNDFDNTPLFGSIREVEDTLGNKFIRIPKLYIKKTDTENLKTWQVSLTKRPGFYLPWCFWDFANSRELPYFDFGKYLGSLDTSGTKLESKSGKYPLVNKNIVQLRDYANANNTGGLSGYQQHDIHAVDVLQTLAFIEFATLDIQAVMQGYTNDGATNSGWKSGACDNVVASSGILTSNDGKYPCMYRGIENPFGNIWQFVDGVNITNNQAWICKDARQYASNVFASPYEQLGYVNHNADGYAQAMGYDEDYPFAEFPTTVNASLKYYKDYYYQATGQIIALFGGGWDDGSAAGLSCWALAYSSSFVYLALGGRLMKKAL